VKLSFISEAEGESLTAYVGTPPWRVEWVEARNGKTDTMAHSHYTEAAARQHVDNLLKQRPEGLSVQDVYTEEI
jgi:hypothetical protein